MNGGDIKSAHNAVAGEVHNGVIVLVGRTLRVRIKRIRNHRAPCKKLLIVGKSTLALGSQGVIVSGGNLHRRRLNDRLLTRLIHIITNQGIRDE